MCKSIYSLLHLECHVFILKSQSTIQFSRSLLPRSVEKRPRRLRLETEIESHSKCNRLYIDLHTTLLYSCTHLYTPVIHLYIYVNLSLLDGLIVRILNATPQKCRSVNLYTYTYLLGIQWVSNPSTENQRISTPAHSNGYT